MITAKEAREIFEASDALIDISNKIRSYAENGRSYITIINPTSYTLDKLKELGYDKL